MTDRRYLTDDEGKWSEEYLVYLEASNKYWDRSWDIPLRERLHQAVQEGLRAEEIYHQHLDGSLTCSACQGAFHLATGHVWSPTLRLCGPCTRNWQRWLKRREAQMGHGMKGLPSFTEAALSSIRVP